jgi:hypothetical protein
MAATGTVSVYCTRCGCKRANHDDAGCVLHTTKCRTSDAESRYFTKRKRQQKKSQVAADYELKRQEVQNHA